MRRSWIRLCYLHCNTQSYCDMQVRTLLGYLNSVYFSIKMFATGVPSCLIVVWKIGSVIFFLYVHVIFMVFRVYLCGGKNIPHRDCSETGAISKYVSNTFTCIAFFIWNIFGKTLFFALNFDLKKNPELVKFWIFYKWYMGMDICSGVLNLGSISFLICGR